MDSGNGEITTDAKVQNQRNFHGGIPYLIIWMSGDSDDSCARERSKLRVLELLRDRPRNHITVGSLPSRYAAHHRTVGYFTL